MRVFIAVHFPEETNRSFSEYINLLSENAEGNFTKFRHLHMTLAFIGEAEQESVSKMIEIMKKSISEKSFRMEFNEIGRFKRGGDSLVWIGGRSDDLFEIHKELAENLSKADLKFDRKKFVPHVTLGRKIRFKSPICSEKEADMFLNSIDACFESEIDRICLMASDLTPNGPIYRELFKISLRPQA